MAARREVKGQGHSGSASKGCPSTAAHLVAHRDCFYTCFLKDVENTDLAVIRSSDGTLSDYGVPWLL